MPGIFLGVKFQAHVCPLGPDHLIWSSSPLTIRPLRLSLHRWGGGGGDFLEIKNYMYQPNRRHPYSSAIST